MHTIPINCFALYKYRTNDYDVPFNHHENEVCVLNIKPVVFEYDKNELQCKKILVLENASIVTLTRRGK